MLAMAAMKGGMNVYHRVLLLVESLLHGQAVYALLVKRIFFQTPLDILLLEAGLWPDGG